LLAGLQREDEAALAAAVDGFTGDAAGHAADEFFSAGHDAEVRAAVLHGCAERVAFGDRDGRRPSRRGVLIGPS